MEDLGIVRGLITVVTLATFLGICWWAFRPASRSRFEADGFLVFDDGEVSVPGPAEPRAIDGRGQEEAGR